MDAGAQTAAGIAAGVSSTVLMHPLDVLKARMQVGTAATLRGAVNQLIAHPSQIYRGLAPNLLGNAVAWGAYYGLYGRLQAWSLQMGFSPSPLHYWTASFCAGILTQAATNPIWVLKTRVLGTASTDAGEYRTIAGGMRAIYRDSGITGFWRGFTPGLMGPLQSALYFMLYEVTKRKVNPNWPDSAQFLFSSATAKSVAATVMYPHQVVRSRMQYADAKLGATIMDVYRAFGLRGFYNGLLANLLRVVPAISITQLVYEKVYQRLR